MKLEAITLTNTSNIFESPFSEYNADILDDLKIKKYWVSPLVQSKLDDHFHSQEGTVFLVGPRGSGKTMILKYYSYGVQMLLEEDKRIDAVGVYVKCDKIAIKDMTLDNENEERLFSNYIVLFIINALLSVIETGIRNMSISNHEIKSLIDELNQNRYFENIHSIELIKERVVNLIEKIQAAKKRGYYSNCCYEDENFIDDIDLFGFMIEKIKMKVGMFSSKKILVMLEQYEDYNSKQQRVIRKIIKKWHEKKVYFRISSRLSNKNLNKECDFNTPRENIKEIDLLEDIHYEDIKTLLKNISNGYLEKSEYFEGKSNNIEDYLGNSINYYSPKKDDNKNQKLEDVFAAYLKSSKETNQKKRVYTGFELIAQLCQCNIRLFINICNNIFMRIYYKDQSFHNIKLPFNEMIQSDGVVEEVYKSFESFRHIEKYGKEIINLVINLGMVIEHYQLLNSNNLVGLGKIEFENIDNLGLPILMCCNKWGILHYKDKCYVSDESLAAIFGYSPFISDNYRLVVNLNSINIFKEYDKLNYNDFNIKYLNDYNTLAYIMEGK